MKKGLVLFLCVIMVAFTLSSCGQSESTDADTVVYGNIVTVDENNPTAEAVTVKDGNITFVGSKEEAETFIGKGTKVLDYGKNYVYPGLLESHTHGYLAGFRRVAQADLSEVYPTDYDKYREILKEFIAERPDNDYYMASGWVENDEYVNKDYLDEICSDKPLIMNTDGAHSCLLNTKALEWAGIDADYAKKAGYDLVHVDRNGNPDGYVCEMQAMKIIKNVPVTKKETKDYLLDWQDFAISKGFTAVADAGAELFCDNISPIYHELEKEGKLANMTVFSCDLLHDDAVTVAKSNVLATIIDGKEVYKK